MNYLNLPIRQAKTWNYSCLIDNLTVKSESESINIEMIVNKVRTHNIATTHIVELLRSLMEAHFFHRNYELVRLNNRTKQPQ